MISATAGYAQQGVHSSGGQAAGSGGSASYSVGQVVFSTYGGGGGSVSEGVQQPYEFFTVSRVINQHINLEMTVFPNPVQYTLFLKIDQEAFEPGLIAIVYTVNGAQVASAELPGVYTELPVAGLASGTYLLQVLDKDQQIRQTFKIIKH